MQLSITEKILGFKHSKKMELVESTLNNLVRKQQNSKEDSQLTDGLNNILKQITEIREANQKADHDPTIEEKAGQRTRAEKGKASTYCGKKRKSEGCKIYTPIDPNSLTLTQRAYYLGHELSAANKERDLEQADASSENLGPDSKGQKRYCVCEKFWDGSEMIECDKCKKWYHPPCLGITAEERETIIITKEWICKFCKVE
ncbi:unnamed protein product [Moneuplotes crassus]|uniref:PHD-type domain-containing protein n=1 Tax=Euplotes crassus TaxID=5936 RepID=A0AAD1UR63_EUPCR|nr:unnamed protein product [Moneuplotes crassus]